MKSLISEFEPWKEAVELSNEVFAATHEIDNLEMRSKISGTVLGIPFLFGEFVRARSPSAGDRYIEQIVALIDNTGTLLKEAGSREWLDFEVRNRLLTKCQHLTKTAFSLKSSVISTP